MKNVKMLFVLLALVSIVLSGCKKEMQKGETANVKFNLTDAPAAFDALNIDVQAVQVHTQANGWVTLNSTLGVINILNYTNGNVTLAAQGDVAAGSIDQVRLVLGSNNSVVVNGVSHQLQSTAQLQQALTIDLSGQLQGGNNYVWTIDFDAAQSVMISSASSFQLLPVLRLIVDESSNITASTTITTGGNGGNTSGTGTVVVSGNNTTGTITGVLNPSTLASVCVTGPNGHTFCSMTDLSGHFTLQAMPSGNYSITITPVLPLLSAHTLTNVVVTAGTTTNIGIVSM